MPTIFVVGSDNAQGVPLLQTVRDAGYHTLPMSDADMALAVLHAIRADLLLVDLTRLEAGGRRLIDEVRRNEQLRFMPILAVGAQQGDAEEFRALKRRVGIGDVIAAGAYTHDGLVNEIRKYIAKPAAEYYDEHAVEWTN
jgi:CheY-like chemotaxis protein